MVRFPLTTAVASTALLFAPAAFAQTVTGPEAQEGSASAYAPAAPAPAEAGTVIDALRTDGQFTVLLTALDQAQLTEVLETQPAISIFAPTDAAFAALPEAERENLLDPANANALRERLLYHVIVADVSASQIEGARGGVETAARAQVLLDGTGPEIKVDDATVVRAEIDAANGAVFAIDKVLDPAASLAATGDH